MWKFREEFALHRNGAFSALIAAAVYGVVHLFAPFIVQSHALLYDLLAEVLIVSVAAFLVVGIVARRSLRPVTQSVWFALTISMGVLYVIAIPTVLDRSLSIYILSKIGSEPMTDVRTLSAAVERDYFDDYDVIPMRLNEQAITGNIEYLSGEIVTVTPRGLRIVALTSGYKALLQSKYAAAGDAKHRQ